MFAFVSTSKNWMVLTNMNSTLKTYKSINSLKKSHVDPSLLFETKEEAVEKCPENNKVIKINVFRGDATSKSTKTPKQNKNEKNSTVEEDVVSIPEEKLDDESFFSTTNKKCENCSCSCKQSGFVTILQCPQYKAA